MSKITELAEKEIVRGSILRILTEVGNEGASTKLIGKALNTAGFTVGRQEVEKELSYLEGKHLAGREHIENRALGISRDIFRITPQGTDVLEGTLQADGIETGEDDVI